MAISETAFKYISDLVYQKAAIVLKNASKGYLIESRLQPLANKNGFATLEEMVVKLRAQPFNRLHWSVVEAMTTNEAYFFRDIHPFEALKKNILPDLIKRRAAERQLNIWCAAASSGQEPYSIAMILRENFPELMTWKLIFRY